ncbi:hypothetical protein AC579_6818 [Pseudocercospora musae]|uniref:Uncharacterized protein n=1 Tax=Pseudocercospora musae TaxID=113226 RepID=A0A139IQL2_9PEZI|nr:hypothetical protein AC579_6818 [Pseudocercospora musae]
MQQASIAAQTDGKNLIYLYDYRVSLFLPICTCTTMAATTSALQHEHAVQQEKQAQTSMTPTSPPPPPRLLRVLSLISQALLLPHSHDQKKHLKILRQAIRESENFVEHAKYELSDEVGVFKGTRLRGMVEGLEREIRKGRREVRRLVERSDAVVVSREGAGGRRSGGRKVRSERHQSKDLVEDFPGGELIVPEEEVAPAGSMGSARSSYSYTRGAVASSGRSWRETCPATSGKVALDEIREAAEASRGGAESARDAWKARAKYSMADAGKAAMASDEWAKSQDDLGAVAAESKVVEVEEKTERVSTSTTRGSQSWSEKRLERLLVSSPSVVRMPSQTAAAPGRLRCCEKRRLDREGRHSQADHAEPDTASTASHLSRSSMSSSRRAEVSSETAAEANTPHASRASSRHSPKSVSAS